MAAKPSTTTSDVDCAPRWRATARVPGILFVTAGLILGLSGALGATDAGDEIRVPPQPDIATGPSTSTTIEAPDQRTPHLELDSGDRLDTEAEWAAFYARIAAQKEAGLHRGPAVYASW